MKRQYLWSIGTLIVAVVFMFGEPLRAQLQQSGGPGSTVTANAGTNLNTSALALEAGHLATIDSHIPAQGQAVAAGSLPVVLTAAQLTTLTPLTSVAVTNTGTFAAQAAQSGTWTMQPGNTANTTAWFVKSVPASTCGTTAVSQALIAVPTSATAVFSATTCLFSVFFENSNAGAQTVTLTDNAGTPLNAVGPAFSIPGLSNMLLPMEGIPFTTGVKWTAGGTGVLGGMAGFQ